MNSKRLYYVMLAVLALLVIGILGGAYAANGLLQKQSAKLVDYKSQNRVAQQEQLGLNKAKQDITTYSSLEQIANTVVPQDKDQALAVREIVKIAADSGIKPSSITFPVSSLGSAVGAAAGGSTATSGSQKPSLSQLTPVKGISGVYTLQIIIQQDANAPVPYARFIDFLSRLEQNRRTAQVSSILLQPTATDRNLVSFSLTVDEFIKP